MIFTVHTFCRSALTFLGAMFFVFYIYAVNEVLPVFISWLCVSYISSFSPFCRGEKPSLGIYVFVGDLAYLLHCFKSAFDRFSRPNDIP